MAEAALGESAADDTAGRDVAGGDTSSYKRRAAGVAAVHTPPMAADTDADDPHVLATPLARAMRSGIHVMRVVEHRSVDDQRLIPEVVYEAQLRCGRRTWTITFTRQQMLLLGAPMQKLEKLRDQALRRIQHHVKRRLARKQEARLQQQLAAVAAADARSSAQAGGMDRGVPVGPTPAGAWAAKYCAPPQRAPRMSRTAVVSACVAVVAVALAAWLGVWPLHDASVAVASAASWLCSVALRASGSVVQGCYQVLRAALGLVAVGVVSSAVHLWHVLFLAMSAVPWRLVAAVSTLVLVLGLLLWCLQAMLVPAKLLLDFDVDRVRGGGDAGGCWACTARVRGTVPALRLVGFIGPPRVCVRSRHTTTDGHREEVSGRLARQ